MTRYLLLLLIAMPCQAEMYVWHDDDGVKHISTVPRECIEGGTVRLECRGQVPTGTQGRAVQRDSGASRAAEVRERLSTLQAMLAQLDVAPESRDYRSELRERREEKMREARTERAVALDKEIRQLQRELKQIEKAATAQ